jgi:hypothetical protein
LPDGLSRSNRWLFLEHWSLVISSPLPRLVLVRARAAMLACFHDETGDVDWPVSDCTAACARGAARLRDSRGLRAELLRPVAEESAQAGEHVRRTRGGVRRGCVCAGARAGSGVRDVLRGGTQGREHHGGGLRGKIAGGGDFRGAGHPRTGEESAVASQGEGFRHATEGVPRADRGVHRAVGSADGVCGNRSRAACGATLQASGLHRAAARHGGCAGECFASAGGVARPRWPRRRR